MTTTSPAMRPWDTMEYQRIVAASYQDGQVIVGFANGDVVRLFPRTLVAPGAPEPNWPMLYADEFHLVVPSSAGELEIPWDVIRSHSDPAYDAYWAEVVSEPVDRAGKRRGERAS